PNRGEYIIASSGRKRVLAFLFFLAPSFMPGRGGNIFPENRNHALTNFFDLSNIRFVSGGSSEMLRTSRCLRTILFQSDGPWTLRTVASFLYYRISRYPKKNLRNHGKIKGVLNDSRVTGRPAKRRARRIDGRPSSAPAVDPRSPAFLGPDGYALEFG